MKNDQYFKHDVSAAGNHKLMILIDELGMKGYGAYWLLLEVLRSQTDYTFPLSLLGRLARRCRVMPSFLLKVINNYGLFVVENDCFHSPGMTRRMRPYDAKTPPSRCNNSHRTGDNSLEISKTDPYNARKEEKKEKREEEEGEKKKEKTPPPSAVFCFDSDEARPATPPLPEACPAQNETLHRPFTRHAPCFAPVCTVVSRAPDRCKINFSLYLFRRLNVTSAHNEKETEHLSPPLYPLPPMESERVCHRCQSGRVHHHRPVTQKRDGMRAAETGGANTTYALLHQKHNMSDRKRTLK